MRQTSRQTKPERENIEEGLIATTDTHTGRLEREGCMRNTQKKWDKERKSEIERGGRDKLKEDWEKTLKTTTKASHSFSNRLLLRCSITSIQNKSCFSDSWHKTIPRKREKEIFNRDDGVKENFGVLASTLFSAKSD